MVSTFPKKDSILGPAIGESDGPVSSALEEPKPNLETIEPKCVDLNSEIRYDVLEKNGNVDNGKNIRVLNLAVKQYGKPSNSSLPSSKSSNCKVSVSPSVIEDDGKKNKYPEIEASHDESRSPRNDKKGKEEKPFSNGDVRISVSKRDGNHESVESSNSGRLFSTAKRAWNFEQELIIEHKKMKKLNNEIHVAASFLKQDSSFLHWIFNMTNRYSKSNPDGIPLFASSSESFHDRQGNHDFLVRSHYTKHGDGGNRSMGFQTMFRAICYPSLEVQGKKVTDFQYIGAESSKELDVINDGLCDHDSNSRTKLRNFSCANITQSKPNNNSWKSRYSCKKPTPSEGKMLPKTGFGNRNNCKNLEINEPHESLWITRFSSKVSASILKALPFNQDTGAAQNPSIEDQMDDRVRKFQSCSIGPTDLSRSKKTKKNNNQKLKDKLSHIPSSEIFKGHHDYGIPHNKDLELLKNPGEMASVYAHKVARSSKKGKELMTHAHSSNDLTEMVNFSNLLLGSRPIKDDLLVLGDNCFKGVAGKRWVFSSFSEDDSKEDQIASCDPIYRQVLAVPEAIFETIKILRVSRSNILRWMKSPYPGFHFEGFFLRLKLGKWEEELGGTGYHVASIIGECKERSCGSCRFPLYVKLGGVKCLVDCRYVSNHDFVEEELMAWWSAILRGGDKLPSVEELNLKLQEKQKWRS